MSVASYIKHDLIANICAGNLVDHLTLDKLSKRYCVSVTPVRHAVRQLINEGYLEQHENRRLAIRSSAAGPGPGPGHVPVKELKDWRQIIGDDLVQLSFAGEPMLLREETTAEKYGISASSIRQIFHHLAGRGILEHLPRRGWRLRPFRQTDLEAFTDIREVLELKAIELAWPRLVDEDLQLMLARNRLPSQDQEEPENDNSLHAYLIEKAQNPYITDFFERHGKYYKALFDWEALDRQAKIQAVQHHRNILKALLARDRAAAEHALSMHIREAHPSLFPVSKWSQP